MRSSSREIRASSLGGGPAGEPRLESGYRNGSTPPNGDNHDIRPSRDPHLLRSHRRHRGCERRDPAYLRLMELAALLARATMKERFPIAPRNIWRRRLLAI